MKLLPWLAAAYLTTAAAFGATSQAPIVTQTLLVCGTVTWDHSSNSSIDPSLLQLALVNRNGDVVAATTASPTRCATATRNPASPALAPGLVRTRAYFTFNAQTIQSSKIAVKVVATRDEAAPYVVRCAYQKAAVACRQISATIALIPATRQADLYLQSPPAAVLQPVAHILDAAIPQASAAAPTAPPIYYATDQIPSPSASAPPSPPSFFQNDRDAITIAACTPVTDPLAGDGCFMSYGKVDQSNTPTPLTLDAFANDLRAVGAKRLVVLLHGFNSNFAGALDQARALSNVIAQRPGENGTTLVLIYGWPAHASDFVFPQDMLKYTDDETNNAWAALHLRDFLAGLLDADPGLKVDIVAHSMGNRLMLDSALALREQSFASVGDNAHCPSGRNLGNYCGRIGQIIAIEPDVDMETYAEDAMRLSGFASGVTIYGHTGDLALVASQKLHGHCRAGKLNCDGVFPTPTLSDGNWWLNVIDASIIVKCDSIFHHSYWPLSTTVLRDLATLIVNDAVMSSSAPRANIEFVSGNVSGSNVQFPHYRIASFDPDDTKCH